MADLISLFFASGTSDNTARRSRSPGDIAHLVKETVAQERRITGLNLLQGAKLGAVERASPFRLFPVAPLWPSSRHFGKNGQSCPGYIPFTQSSGQAPCSALP